MMYRRIGAIFVLVAAVAIFSWLRESTAPVPTPPFLIVFTDTEELTGSILKTLNAPYRSIERWGGDWKEEDGSFGLYSGYGADLIYDQPENKGFLSKEEINQWKKKFDDLFKDMGFVLSDPNTFGTNYFAYERQNFKCVVSLWASSKPFGSLFCGEFNAEGTALRKEFAPIINPENSPENLVYVNKVLGEYAAGREAGWIDGRGGAIWVAHRINGTWKIIAEGNETFSCQKMDEYGVPLEVYQLCTDYKNGGTQRRFQE